MTEYLTYGFSTLSGPVLLVSNYNLSEKKAMNSVHIIYDFNISLNKKYQMYSLWALKISENPTCLPNDSL